MNRPFRRKTSKTRLFRRKTSKNQKRVRNKIQNGGDNEKYDKYLRAAGFFRTNPSEEEITDIRNELRNNFLYNKDWVDCFDNKKTKNRTDQIIKKIHCYMKSSDPMNM